MWHLEDWRQIDRESQAEVSEEKNPRRHPGVEGGGAWKHESVTIHKDSRLLIGESIERFVGR